MDPELQTIKDQVIAAIVGKEDELLAAQEKIQAALDHAGEELEQRSAVLEARYLATPGSSSAEYMKEYRALEVEIKAALAAKLEAIVKEVTPLE